VSRILFQLTAFAATAFIITILSMIAMMMGDPDAPVNHWFDKHGATLMVVEVIGIVFFGLAAMTADRRETLRAQNAKAGDFSSAQDAKRGETASAE
jgi:heme/copper-type cytochrome/quinol oxidase subunit 1